MIVLCWDIDGTLLTTGRAGVFALEDACLAVTGKPLDLQGIKSDGLTDHQIVAAILEQSDVEASSVNVDRFLRHYEAHLPGRLPMRQGRVLEGVREILSWCRANRPDIHSMLLTGNTPGGARAKLTYYGLQEFFEGGAFSEDLGPRSGIAARALAAVRAKLTEPAIEPRKLFVIGDTPHDIAAAQAIGARAIAVATGVYSADALRMKTPWLVLERLPDPEQFVALLERSRAQPSGRGHVGGRRSRLDLTGRLA